MEKISLTGTDIYYRIFSKESLDTEEALKLLAREAFGLEIQIMRKNRKPIIENYPDIFCSASDSRDMGFVALSRHSEIGIDIEYMRPRVPELFDYCCDQNEKEMLTAYFKGSEYLPSIAWSLKESAQKADDLIHHVREYTIDYSNGIMIHRGENKWHCVSWIHDNYFFSVSIKNS
jgi:phosphopantetheinyl transferase